MSNSRERKKSPCVSLPGKKTMALATTTTLLTGLGGAYVTAALKKTADDIAEQLAQPDANTTLIAEEAAQLSKNLFMTSRVQGIVVDLALYFIAIPSIWETMGYSPKRIELDFLSHAWKNKGHYAGRGLQLLGLGVLGEGLRQDGSDNPQIATACAAAGSILMFGGSQVINYNKGRQMEASLLRSDAENDAKTADRNSLNHP